MREVVSLVVWVQLPPLGTEERGLYSEDVEKARLVPWDVMWL